MTTATETVRDIVEAALLDIEAMAMGQDIPDRQAGHAMKTLNRLLKSWQLMDGSPDFLRASLTLNLTTAASYTLSPARPIRILSARLSRGGIETPMIELTRGEYDDLPRKNSTGLPTQFYYDRQREAALFYVWPVLAVANGETVRITYEREFADITTLSQTIDLPSEWHDVAVKQLAARLAPAYGSEAAKQNMPIEAELALRRALGAGMAGESVYFRA